VYFCLFLCLCVCFYLFHDVFIEQILPVLVRFGVTVDLKMTCSYHISK
jgi:hypothetical protein